MIQDLSPDVKKFLLSYTSINQLTGLAQDELSRIFELLEAEIAHQSWFSAQNYQSKASWKWLQVWKNNWYHAANKCMPWIHFEYTFSWADQWVQASVDIEPKTALSNDFVMPVVNELYSLLSSKKISVLEGKGWLLRPQLEANRMLLLKRRHISSGELTGDWIFKSGIELLDELSEIVPQVDATLERVIPKP